MNLIISQPVCANLHSSLLCILTIWSLKVFTGSRVQVDWIDYKSVNQNIVSFCGERGKLEHPGENLYLAVEWSIIKKKKKNE